MARVVKIGDFNLCASGENGWRDGDDVCPRCHKKDQVHSAWEHGSVHIDGVSVSMASRHHRCARCKFDWESQIEFAGNAGHISLVPFPGCGRGRTLATERVRLQRKKWMEAKRASRQRKRQDGRA